MFFNAMVRVRCTLCNRISCYIVSIIVYVLTLAPSLSFMSPGCKLSPSSSVSDIVLCVQALSFLTSVPCKNPELYHSNVLPLKSLLGAIICVILRASCGLRVDELTGNSTVV